MRTVFFGTPAVAVPALTAVQEAGHEIVLVITRGDRPRGRSGTPVAPPVKQAASELGLSVLQPAKVRGAEFRGRLGAIAPELLVVVAYGRILPVGVLGVASHGAVNLHFSLLPRYRGAAPVQWALARGESATGVTTMRMTEGLDEGPILRQEETRIRTREHAPALAARLADSGARLLLETIGDLAAGRCRPIEQDPRSVSYAPMLTRQDGDCDPTLDAREVEGRIRGFDPWPGVWLRRGRKRLRLVEAEAEAEAASSASEAPGTVVAGPSSDVPMLICGQGSRLLLHRLQPEGRRVMTAGDALRGRQLQIGDVLEGPSAAAGPAHGSC